MFRTLQQNSRLHKLLGDLRIDAESKEELVYKFTNGRTSSSKEMIVSECSALIQYLTNLAEKPTGTRKPNDPADRQRKKILSICHEMNWHITGNELDWPRIDAWLLKYGYLHKKLNDYTAKELPRLVTQFENLLKSYYAKG